MKNVKRNSIIVLLLTIGVMYFVLKDNFAKTFLLLGKVNIPLFLLSIIIFLIALSIDTIAMKKIINIFNKEYSFLKTLKVNLITRFFSGITPFATGGQPMQVYEFSKDNIKVTDGTAIAVINYYIFQIAVVIIGTTAVLANQVFNIFEKNLVFKYLVMLGFVINIIIFIILYLLTHSLKFVKKISRFIIKLLHKIRIVKDCDKTIIKWDKKVKEFSDSAIIMSNNKTLIIKCVVIEFIYLLILYTVPFFIIKSIDPSTSLNIFKIIIATTYVHLIGYYIPIPGATGGMEFGFLGLFSNFIGTVLNSSAVILWRFLTYFFPTILGALVFNFFNKRKNVKS